jgi:hypothetical protein
MAKVTPDKVEGAKAKLDIKKEFGKIKNMPPPGGEPDTARSVNEIAGEAGTLPTLGSADFANNKFEVGGIFQLANYYVQIIGFEKAKREDIEPTLIRYRKGFVNEVSGKIEWKAEVLGNKNQIEKWLKGGNS